MIITNSILKLIFALLILTSIRSYSQTEDIEAFEKLFIIPSWQSDSLVGKVKSFSQTAIRPNATVKELAPGEIDLESTEFLTFTKFFDNQGYLSSISYLYNGKEALGKYFYDFENQNIIFKNTSQGSEFSRILYDLDKKKNILSYKYFSPVNTLLVEVKANYDKDNHIVLLKVIEDDVKTNYKITKIYNELGQLIEMFIIDFYKNIRTHKKYQYAASGDVRFEQDYKYDFSNQSDINLEGNLDERVTRQLDYFYSSSNENGKIVYYNSSDNVPVIFIYRYKYDQHGQVVEKISEYEDGTEYYHAFYSFKYDEKGNWVNRTETVDGKIMLIINREFTYFD